MQVMKGALVLVHDTCLISAFLRERFAHLETRMVNEALSASEKEGH